VYTLLAWLHEHLPAVLDEHGEVDAEVAEAMAAAARAAEAAAEAEAGAYTRPRFSST